ncbi:hypothetical protein JTE90_003764 [Oedothorax gibbosus]|uniref:Ferric-chelate reductase 1 n=1 Tax=Oedothorax gibbosus TaxID=931172 RepID=A0AAV6VD64_9ARAC|nr:hypothetical protein JTE90_003764 [Oedothorax gibbosus]
MLWGCLLTLAAVYTCVESRADGAPKTACSTLTPVHPNFEPQRGSSSYEVSAEKLGNNKVGVTIMSRIGEEIQGFVLQARSAQDPSKLIEGKFSTQNGVTKTVDCFRGSQNTLTHTHPRAKQSITAEWTPSADLNEDVIFRATVAKTYAIFYTKVDSPRVRISAMGMGQGSSSQSSSSQQPGYTNCFVSKGCFGYPPGCVNDNSCDVLLTFMSTGNSIQFTMMGSLETNSYMAMGFSRDNLMGDDYVTSCVLESGSRIKVQESYNNQRKQNLGLRELANQNNVGSYRNGQTTCTFSHPFLAEDPRGDVFNLQNQTYYLLLAIGPYDKENDKLVYHKARTASAERVNFTSFESINAEGASDSVKIHGTFMITAWIGFASVAILLARHFKSAFYGRELGGVKIWFAFHRGFMLVALIFIIIAAITIFVYKKGWNYETSNPHAIFGIISTALAVCQPIMAVFRPSPDHSKRKIFNVAHFLVGNSAYILAIIAMFLAVSLEGSGLKQSFYYVLAIFVVVHVIFHAIFQVHTLTSGKQTTNEVKMLDMSQARSNTMQNDVSEKKNQAEIFKVLLLGFYSIFLVIILLTMYSLIGVA